MDKMQINFSKYNYFKLVNLWKEKSDFFHCTILAIGKTDDQYYVVLFNFSFILSIIL